MKPKSKIGRLLAGAGLLMAAAAPAQSIRLTWEMRAGSTYYFWWKENLTDAWQPVAVSTMAGAAVFTNKLTVYLSDAPRKGWVGTNELAIEVLKTSQRFFMITTNEAGSLTVPVTVVQRSAFRIGPSDIRPDPSLFQA
jgi:hypothetical protein